MMTDVCFCSNGPEDESAGQLQMCIPVYSADKTALEMTSNRNSRLRKSIDEDEIWVPNVRMGRNDDSAKTFTFSSTFTPRLGRKRSNSPPANNPSKHVINLNAGSAFTPRLGRRIQNL